MNYLFWFLSVWTVLQFTMCVCEFLKVDNFSAPPAMPVSYFLLIFIYVLRKEVNRWLKLNGKKRHGELFLLGWWIALLIMFGVEFLTHSAYTVPQRMMETCVWVLIPYAASSISKIVHGYVPKPRTR